MTQSSAPVDPLLRGRRLVVDAHAGLGPFGLALLGCAVGFVAGLGAVVFRGLIALVHNLLFLGKVSWS